MYFFNINDLLNREHDEPTIYNPFYRHHTSIPKVSLNKSNFKEYLKDPKPNLVNTLNSQLHHPQHVGSIPIYTISNEDTNKFICEITEPKNYLKYVEYLPTENIEGFLKLSKVNGSIATNALATCFAICMYGYDVRDNLRIALCHSHSDLSHDLNACYEKLVSRFYEFDIKTYILGGDNDSFTHANRNYNLQDTLDNSKYNIQAMVISRFYEENDSDGAGVVATPHAIFYGYFSE